eukprot:1183933-Prorocentrum_minimum.AAC.1
MTCTEGEYSQVRAGLSAAMSGMFLWGHDVGGYLGSASKEVGYIPPPLLRLVLTLGIYRLPSCDWFSRWVHTASPPTIGSPAGYILPPLLRLVLTL